MRLEVVPKVFERLTGQRPSTSTWRRWFLNGVKSESGRVKLEVVKLGGRIYTTERMAHEFLTRSNKPSSTPSSGSDGREAAIKFLDTEIGSDERTEQ